jgi:hypothetical protein
MFERDLLVSFIAFALGFLMISSAYTNYERAFEMRTPQYLTETIGRTGARLVMGTIGLLIVLMGIYILCAPFFFKSDAIRSPEDKLILEESSTGILAEGR